MNDAAADDDDDTHDITDHYPIKFIRAMPNSKLKFKTEKVVCNTKKQS